jgi:hypothetical protein
MNSEAVERFFGWIKERHSIYQHRAGGDPPPWTEDPILQEYKFTNPFRENDRVTVWMRKNWTAPNDKRPSWEIFFNCCLFRMVGTSEFANAHGWVNFSISDWDPLFTKELIQERLAKGQKTFTGAYIITNQGIKAPKSQVVIDHFLMPINEAKFQLAETAATTNSLQETHNFLSTYRGWGGGGFMAYEVITDLNHTSVLKKAHDRFTWANAGPGAKRGLNRLAGNSLTKGMKQEIANSKMHSLLQQAPQWLDAQLTRNTDMRTIEHSLCEWDKYERVRLKEGRPRAKFSADDYLSRTPVIGPIP